jgi:hypothetical protein
MAMCGHTLTGRVVPDILRVVACEASAVIFLAFLFVVVGRVVVVVVGRVVGRVVVLIAASRFVESRNKELRENFYIRPDSILILILSFLVCNTRPNTIMRFVRSLEMKTTINNHTCPRWPQRQEPPA